MCLLKIFSNNSDDELDDATITILLDEEEENEGKWKRVYYLYW